MVGVGFGGKRPDEPDLDLKQYYGAFKTHAFQQRPGKRPDGGYFWECGICGDTAGSHSVVDYLYLTDVNEWMIADDVNFDRGESMLPTDAKERKNTPIATGVLDYFPLAIAEIARVSKAGNDQHNPGEPLHWAKDKSTDHADCIARHLIERGTVDVDGMRHSAKLAWRALANLQIELETEIGR